MKVRELLRLLSEEANPEDEVRFSIIGTDHDGAFIQGDGKVDDLTTENGYVRLTGSIVVNADDHDDSSEEY